MRKFGKFGKFFAGLGKLSLILLDKFALIQTGLGNFALAQILEGTQMATLDKIKSQHLQSKQEMCMYSSSSGCFKHLYNNRA